MDAEEVVKGDVEGFGLKWAVHVMALILYR